MECLKAFCQIEKSQTPQRGGGKKGRKGKLRDFAGRKKEEKERVWKSETKKPLFRLLCFQATFKGRERKDNFWRGSNVNG